MGAPERRPNAASGAHDAPPGAVNALHFGVCIGIDRYPGFPDLDLGSARDDALAFHDWLVSPDGGGLPAANATVITATIDEQWSSPFDARPHVRELNRALHAVNVRIRDHLDQHPDDWPQTRVYLYAAGHGVGPPRGECGILMADADPDLLGNYVDVSKYRDWYLACELVHEVVILADCCRELIEGVPPANEVPFTACRLDGPTGTTSFTAYATRLGDRAWEPSGRDERDRARGYFTRALLRGLEGGAADASGAVTSPALGQYVGAALAELTRSAPFEQQAEPHHRPGSAIVFAGRRDRVLQRVEIRFAAGWERPVVVLAGEGTHGPWQPAIGPWILDLPSGLYEVATADGSKIGSNGLFKVAGADVELDIP